MPELSLIGCLTPPFWFTVTRLLSVGTPVGRKARDSLSGKGLPLARVRRRDIAAVGVERVSRVVGVDSGLPLLEDGRTLRPSTVVWCTGFRPDFSWIDLPIFDDDGKPRHDRGCCDGGAWPVFRRVVLPVHRRVVADRRRRARRGQDRLAHRYPPSGRDVAPGRDFDPYVSHRRAARRQLCDQRPEGPPGSLSGRREQPCVDVTIGARPGRGGGRRQERMPLR